MRLRNLFNFSERKVDPMMLAQRVSRRYGKQNNYGDVFDKPVVGSHIPVPYTKHTDQSVDLIDEIIAEILKKTDDGTPYMERYKKYIRKYDTTATLPITSLTPIQPYVRTDDPSVLKTKMSDTNPSHIRVILFADKYYIMDGHHAVMAAAMRGEKSVPVTITDLDALEERYL